MTAEPTFGRRQAPSDSGASAAGRSAPAPRPVADPHALSSRAEAFRAELSSGQSQSASEFSSWLRGQQGRRVFAWVVGLAFLSPGAVCFLLQMPLEDSIGLEVVGMFANWWVRRERRRQLKEIATWESPDAPP